MRVLLVAHSYPPDPAVGSFRAAKVAHAFHAAGHQVDVLTARLPDERSRSRCGGLDIRVHTVREIPHPRYAYLWAKSLVSSLARNPRSAIMDASGMPETPAATPRRSRPGWMRRLMSLLWIPDQRQGFILPALLRSLTLLRGRIDLIYTTAPPFSDHLIGLVLKRIHGVPWVAEFRDPWINDTERTPDVLSRQADRMNRWLERQCLGNADYVVAVSESTREHLGSKMAADRRDRVITVLNGIDTIDTAPHSRPNGGPFRIVYAGSLYLGRDPRPFFLALSSLRHQRALGPADLRVEFIGAKPTYHGESLERMVRELCIADLVEFLPWMPQSQARARMREADLLLLLFRNHRIQIPNKLYDYLGARRPILAMVAPDGEAARMLRQVDGHRLVFDGDPVSLEGALADAMDAPRTVLSVNGAEAALQRWSTERQMQYLLRAIGAAAP